MSLTTHTEQRERACAVSSDSWPRVLEQFEELKSCSLPLYDRPPSLSFPTDEPPPLSAPHPPAPFFVTPPQPFDPTRGHSSPRHAPLHTSSYVRYPPLATPRGPGKSFAVPMVNDLQGHRKQFPVFEGSHGFHHSTFECLLSAGLVPRTTPAFVTSGSPTPLLDGLLGITPYRGAFSYSPESPRFS
jgi:hypothetical protein